MTPADEPDATGELRPRAPTPEGLNAEFYERAQGGVLHLQQCARCGRFRHPPRYLCPHCFSPSYRWTPSAGAGELFTWTVTHHPFDRGWRAALPYATVAVQLTEGVRVIGAYSGELAALRPGLELTAEIDTQRFEFPFVRFRPSTVPGGRRNRPDDR